jgi:two-component system alkaline phosphatase synthesis response regulator PhoP
MRLQAGTLTLDMADRNLYLNGNGADPVRLFPMEARLLAALMGSPGRILSRAELMRIVWQTDYLADTRTLDVHICWLRQKIERDPSQPRHILTHRGRGYQFKV